MTRSRAPLAALLVAALPVLLAALPLLTGCASSKFRKAKGFDVRVPLRVAVLPFMDRTSPDNLISRPLAAAIDVAPILSDDELTQKNAATIFRIKATGALHQTPLHVIDPHVVDSILDHRGVDVQKAYLRDRASAARKLAGALGADAVLFGEVTEWNRSYYGVASVVSAGLRLELREGTGGSLLYRAEVNDSKDSGVHRLPVVYSPSGAIQSTVGEALKGLRNTQFGELSDDIARQAVEGLGPSAADRASAPPPEIRYIAHSAIEPVRRGDEIVVVAIGSPGARATFRIGESPMVSMTETVPGSYRGTFRVGARYRFHGSSITVRFVSEELRATEAAVASPGVWSARR